MIYVILGQTASGKTSTAIEIAKKYDLPIISADAYQCYKMMQIGTDKPTREEVGNINYHFYDEYEPDIDMDVYTFQRTMRPILEKYRSENRDVLVVGGTFLYIKALLFNYVFSEKDNTDSIYRTMSLEELQNQLKNKNENIFNQIDNKNPRRLIRALEQIDEGYDRNQILNENDEKPLYPTTFLAIDIDKEEGNKKIDDRIDLMFKKGIVEEVKNLIEKYPLTCHSFLAIGYKEIIDGLKENKSEDEMKELIKIHTHQYAKKQRTFISHQFKDVYRGTKDEIKQIIETNIQMFSRTKVILKPDVMNKMQTDSVYLVGLGGVGGACFTSLIRLGINDITIQDGDIVDPSNLNRQCLYEVKDIGKSKAEIAKEKGLNINPLINVEVLNYRIEDKTTISNKKYDVIFDCIDDCEAKVLLYEKAKKDNSLYFTSMGMGFHANSTKLKQGYLKDAFDPLSKKFVIALLNKGHTQEEIDRIPCVFAIDQTIKGKKNSKVIGSISTVPNASGLALTSYYLSYCLKK